MNPLYEERLSSVKTQALFAMLAVIFGLFGVWRINTTDLDGPAILTIVLALVFLFYVLNYRTLVIRIDKKALTLQFGIFSWTVPIKNIATCELDDNIPPFLKYGGAGIHFMTVDGRYRASFNFLEYERVVIRLKEKQGWVQDVSFSTKQSAQITKTLLKGVS